LSISERFSVTIDVFAVAVKSTRSANAAELT